MKLKVKKRLNKQRLRTAKAEDLDKKLREKSLIETRKAKRMILIEQYARENKVTIAQAMVHFMRIKDI